MSSTPSSSSLLPTRVLKLQGALNFRDMGGYRSTDGRTVRWNKLYRSGTTHEMTDADLQLIAASGIRYACDLRSNSERKNYPNQLSRIAEIEYWYRDHDKVHGDITRMMLSPNSRPEDFRNLMKSNYRSLPYEFREAYAVLFTRLADKNLPLVFNCTVGKDRTGVVAALVLWALGVPRELIIEDYLLTEQFYDQNCAMLFRDERNALFKTVDQRIWEPLMRAEASYLEAMFEQIEQDHGTIEKYLCAQLGVDTAMLGRLRDSLLEARHG